MLTYLCNINMRVLHSYSETRFNEQFKLDQFEGHLE